MAYADRLGGLSTAFSGNSRTRQIDRLARGIPSGVHGLGSPGGSATLRHRFAER